MQSAEQLWGVKQFDLMQVHNMLDWETHLETLKQWKVDGRIRYLGITTSHGRRHEALEQALTHERFDFVQFTYNVVDREAEARLLPLAAERGIAVIINRPFQGGGLFGKVKGKPLPAFARDLDCPADTILPSSSSSRIGRDLRDPATSRADHLGHARRNGPFAGHGDARTHGPAFRRPVAEKRPQSAGSWLAVAPRLRQTATGLKGGRMPAFLNKLKLPAPHEALPGRAQVMRVPEAHFVNGLALTPPYPGGLELALFGLGCFWGAEKCFWQVPGVHVTAVSCRKRCKKSDL
jgi:hypothetical protein